MHTFLSRLSIVDLENEKRMAVMASIVLFPSLSPRLLLVLSRFFRSVDDLSIHIIMFIFDLVREQREERGEHD